MTTSYIMLLLMTWGLTKIEVGIDFMVRQVMKGEAISVDDCIAINRKVNAKLVAYSENEKEAMSIQDLLDQVELSPAHRLLISSRLQTSQGTTLDKVALRIMGGSFSTRDGQSAYHRIDGGNQASRDVSRCKIS